MVHMEGGEGDSSKIRKPYTITKQREIWTEDEHTKFLEALSLYGRDWKKLENFVGSKTVIQIRSHAQKYFLKVEKNGTGEIVPPPRPKRKSSQPYPQKAKSTAGSKKRDREEMAGYAGVQGAGAAGGFRSHPGVQRPWQGGGASDGSMYPGGGGQPMGGGMKLEPADSFNGGQSSEMGQGRTPVPNFAMIYAFLGSLFDEDMDAPHLPLLSSMVPIDRETVITLMRNLSGNLLSSSVWDDQLHRLIHGKPSIVNARYVGSTRQQTR